MSNVYATKLLVDQRIAELHHEADQDRLARAARAARVGQHRRRWWERLMLFRLRTQTATAQRPAAPRPAAPRPAATVTASDSPC